MSRSMILALCLVATACGGDDGGDDGDNADDSGGNPGPGSNADDGNDDGGASTGGNADGGGATSNASAADDGGGTCEGDWSLGSVPFVGDGILVACDANPPKNCADGYYIVFGGTGECICLPQCSSFQDVGLGDSCNADGSVVCQAIKSTSGDSSGNFCTPTQWNLCGP